MNPNTEIDRDLIDRLERFYPRGEIIAEETIDVSVNDVPDSGTFQQTYPVPKRPFTRVTEATVSDETEKGERGLTVGQEVEAVDTTGDGEFDRVQITIENSSLVTEDTVFRINYQTESVLARVGSALDDDRSAQASQIDQVVDSKQLQNASGSELDRRGELFGSLGERDGRSDEEYRSLLRTVVKAFSGRGTVEGFRFAVALGTQTQPSNVEITEDFDKKGFKVTVNTDQAVITTGLNDLIQRASPSGVTLLSPPVVQTRGTTLSLSGPGSTVSGADGGGTTLGETAVGEERLN